MLLIAQDRPRRATPDSTAAASTPAAKPGARLVFLDNLRLALTLLVVLHHLAVIYSLGPFYYVEPPRADDALAFIVLTLFVLLNQAYFMGLFFLLAGYFTPAALDRKGWRLFLKDRLLRLGLPLIAFIFVLNPLASLGIYQMPAEWTGVTTPLSWQSYPALLGVGPLWFVELLLLFDGAYVVWRLATRARPLRLPVRSHSLVLIGAYVGLLAVTSYLTRIALPIGTTVPVVGLPSAAYLPQYVSFFVLGTVAARSNWLRHLTGRHAKRGAAVAGVATLVCVPLALSGGTAFAGGGTWQSAVYAVWDALFAVGVSTALLVLFQRVLDRQNDLVRWLSRHAYAVYIVHAPLIVLLALALRPIQAEQLLKFGLASVLGLPLCFAAAFLLRRAPGVARVL